MNMIAALTRLYGRTDLVARPVYWRGTRKVYSWGYGTVSGWLLYDPDTSSFVMNATLPDLLTMTVEWETQTTEEYQAE